MEQPSGGSNPASRQEAKAAHRGSPSRRRGGGGGGAGEDRLGDLPDALLLLVLAGLGSADEAARTSVLSQRWRYLWLGLPVLAFRGAGPDQLVDLLSRGATARAELRRLEIRVPARRDRVLYTAAQVSSLLRAAEERSPEEFVFDVGGGDDIVPPFELPCFARATSMNLQIWNRSFTLPPAGEFANLDSLTLSLCCVDPAEFLPRCPVLRVLDICFYWLLEGEVAVHSDSLQELVVKDVATPWGDKMTQHLDIDAPLLRKFRLQACGNRNLITTFSEETVVENCVFKYFSKTSRPVGIGTHWRLLGLTMAAQWISSSRYEEILSLMILGENLPHYLYAKRGFVEELAQVGINNDDISALKLDFQSDRPRDFGTVVFHLLDALNVIQRLHLVLRPKPVQGVFPPQGGVDFDADIWRNHYLFMEDLGEVVIEGLDINSHDLEFLKVLFASAPLLKILRIELSDGIPRSCLEYKKLCQIFWDNAPAKCYVNGILEDCEENLPPTIYIE